MIKDPMFTKIEVTPQQNNLNKILNDENERVMKERGTPTRKNIYYEGYTFFPNMNSNLQTINKED